jgi:hypothetical protein
MIFDRGVQRVVQLLKSLSGQWQPRLMAREGEALVSLVLSRNGKMGDLYWLFDLFWLELPLTTCLGN